jgi:hypothetical protein
MVHKCGVQDRKPTASLGEPLAGGRLFALADSPDKGKSRKGDELMRGKNVKYLLVVVVLLALGFGVGRLSAAAPRAAG